MTQLTSANRRARPRNRRELILGAASDLFAEQGYAKVAMGDLAKAVGITSAALYRHFSGKQEILAEVLAAGLAPVHKLVAGLDDADPADALASCALDQRRMGLMWQREMRHLDPETCGPIKSLINEIIQGLTGYVRSVRPELAGARADLLGRSVLAVLISPSFHRLELPRPAYDQLLAELVRTVVAADLPAVPPGSPGAPSASAALRPASRREELLTEALRMFALHGFAQVGIEDIGNAVGITGPTVYNYWPTKLDLLITALSRGAAALAVSVSTAYRQATSPVDALHRLLRCYVELSHSHSEVFGLLITDIDHLPAEELNAVRRAQHEYVSEWVHLLRLSQPQLDLVTARIRVHAVLSVANDAGRSAQFLGTPPAPEAVVVIATGLLGLPPHSSV